jgi:hypothetical protein
MLLCDYILFRKHHRGLPVFESEVERMGYEVNSQPQLYVQPLLDAAYRQFAQALTAAAHAAAQSLLNVNKHMADIDWPDIIE